MAKHILVVLTNPVEGKDAEYNDWYTNQHLGDVIGIEGYVAARRYKLSDGQLSEGQLPYGYLAIYEVETDDLPATAKRLTGTDMYISPALDMTTAAAWLYTPITERVAR
jgi:hypothetical protein